MEWIPSCSIPFHQLFVYSNNEITLVTTPFQSIPFHTTDPNIPLGEPYGGKDELSNPLNFKEAQYGGKNVVLVSRANTIWHKIYTKRQHQIFVTGRFLSRVQLPSGKRGSQHLNLSTNNTYNLKGNIARGIRIWHQFCIKRHH